LVQWQSSGEGDIIRRGDIKRYREHLNALNDIHPDAKWRNRTYGQRTRSYGDYLYAQDREKFMMELEEWLNENLPADGT